MSQVIKYIMENNLEELKALLLKEPKSILDKDELGVEACLYAGKVGNIELMKYVVEYTVASFNVTDSDGKDILHYGTMSGNLELVQYLVERVGMKVTTCDYHGVSPYHIARQMGYKEIEEYYEAIVGSKLEDMYQNPIRTGMYPDPSILRVGEDYYMVNSTFVFFPCIPISHSKDLIHWEVIGHAITDENYAYLDELEGGRGYWAPDISYNEGRFYITATYRMNDTGDVCRKQVVVSSDKAEGPYTLPVFIDEDGIDPSIFTDVDGRRYMLLNRGARIFEISKDGTKKIGESSLLYYGSNKRAPEGPHIVIKDGWYYLFLAEGGTGLGHQISVARSRSLMGPYEDCPYNPIMTQKNREASLQCCGHGKPVMTQDGDWYMVYLCNRYIEGIYGMLGRETSLDPITWTADEWPIINQLQGPSSLQRKPKLREYKKSSGNESLDDFTGDQLRNIWFTPRRFESNGVKIENSYLHINGSKKDLREFDARNLVLQRQSSFSFDAVTKLKVPVMIKGQNLGMTCYYDENTFLKYGLFQGENGIELQVHEKIDKLERISLSRDINIEEKELYLKIETRGLVRSFYYSENGVDYNLLGTLDNVYYICSEGIVKGKRFTGATIGMYVYAGESKLIGEFDTFLYKNMI